MTAQGGHCSQVHHSCRSLEGAAGMWPQVARTQAGEGMPGWERRVVSGLGSLSVAATLCEQVSKRRLCKMSCSDIPSAARILWISG